MKPTQILLLLFLLTAVVISHARMHGGHHGGMWGRGRWRDSGSFDDGWPCPGCRGGRGRGCRHGGCGWNQPYDRDDDDAYGYLRRILGRGGRGRQGVMDPQGAPQSDCSALAERGDCSFIDCFTQRFPGCDTSYGFIGNLRRSCFKYEELRSEFSESGQRWIRESRACALGFLKQKYETMTSYTCRDINRYASSIAVSCMNTTDFCTAVRNDMTSIFAVLNTQRGHHYRFWASMLQKLSICGQEVLDEFVEVLQQRVRDGLLDPFLARLVPGVVGIGEV